MEEKKNNGQKPEEETYVNEETNENMIEDGSEKIEPAIADTGANNVKEKNKKQKKKKSAGREILEWVQAIAIAVVLALVVRNFVFNVVKVDGRSMEPTLQHGDRMIVWQLGYEPKAGDIVVFQPPGENKYWIKRVIATEGQHVEIDYSTNSVYVDGEKLRETYLGEKMKDLGFAVDELDVPEGCVFVMGDNRNHSSDGRVIGPVSTDEIIGKAVLRFWPLDKMKFY